MTVSPLSFPNLGDRALALRVAGSTPDVEVVIDLIYVAVGNNGVSLAAGGLTPMQGTELERLATMAVQRLSTAAQS